MLRLGWVLRREQLALELVLVLLSVVAVLLPGCVGGSSPRRALRMDGCEDLSYCCL